MPEIDDRRYIYIRGRRKALKMTQTELAQRAGISRTYLSMLENGTAQNPSVAIYDKLVWALGSETFDKPEAATVASCYLCGTTNYLHMIPHRKRGQLVGWIFACEICGPALYGTELFATLPDNHNVEIIAGGQDANRLRHG